MKPKALPDWENEQVFGIKKLPASPTSDCSKNNFGYFLPKVTIYLLPSRQIQMLFDY